MKTMMVEIRDRATFIPALVVCGTVGGIVGTPDCYLLRRVGWASPETEFCFFMPLSSNPGNRCAQESYEWGDNNRTFTVAHEWLIEHWRDVNPGDVIDVEFILGETDKPKESERLRAPFCY